MVEVRIDHEVGAPKSAVSVINSVIVPTEKFDAAKEAFRKVESTMHPDLADAFRAVFGE